MNKNLLEKYWSEGMDVSLRTYPRKVEMEDQAREGRYSAIRVQRLGMNVLPSLTSSPMMGIPLKLPTYSVAFVEADPDQGKLSFLVLFLFCFLCPSY